MSSPTSGDDPTVRGRDEAGAAGAAAHAGGADAGDSAHAIGDIPASAARGSSAADAGEDQETGVSAGASRDATLPVTDRPTVPTQIGRRDAAATSSSGGKGLWAGDVTAEPGGAFSAAEDARNRADIGGEERGPSSGQGGAARGGTGGETGGAAPDSREVAERDLSTVDTLASGIPVTAVLGYDARQAAGPRSPFGPPPQDPAGTGSGMLGARTVLGGVLGAVVGFLGGVVLALFTAVAFESGAIALATLLFATLGGAMIGSAFGQRLSAASAPAPMSTPPSGGRPQAHRPAGPAGTARTAPEAAGTATGAERPPGAPTGTPRATGPGTSAAGMPGVRRAGPQEYVPPSLFPRPVLPKAPSWLLPAAAVVGVVAAIALPADPPGLGFVVVAALMGLAVLPAARRRVTPWSIAFAVVAYALVAFALLRDAEWLVAPLLAAGFGLGALAVSGGRGWLGVIRGGLSVPLAVFQLPWFLSEPVRRLVPRRGGASLAAGTGLTVVLVTIFAVLFASADAVFSSLLGDLFQAPAWADTLPARIFVFVVFVTLVAAAVLVALRPVAEPVMPDIRLRASRTLWMMPLIALNLLFAAFVSVQITVLFGGDERVLNTANLTYAEYARSGFFELVTVSVFVLAIVAAASGGLAVGRGRDRWWLAILLGLLCVLTLVVLASALHRLNLYTDAYGLSRLRAAVIATSWWLAAVFVLVLVAGAVRLAHGRLAWLPRALILLTGVSLVAFAAWNPDLRVAESQHHIRGVTRLDVNYLRRLGAEAVPALDRLPEPARSCVLEGVYQSRRLYEPERSWGGWNLAREEAREIIRRKPFDRQASCPY